MTKTRNLRLVPPSGRLSASAIDNPKFGKLVEISVDLLEAYLQRHFSSEDVRCDPYWIQLNDELDVVFEMHLVDEILVQMNRSKKSAAAVTKMSKDESERWPLLAFLVNLRSDDPIGTSEY